MKIKTYGSWLKKRDAYFHFTEVRESPRGQRRQLS